MPFKMHKISFFYRKKMIEKKCVPTLPKIFRPVTQNTYFLFGLSRPMGFFSLQQVHNLKTDHESQMQQSF